MKQFLRKVILFFQTTIAEYTLSSARMPMPMFYTMIPGVRYSNCIPLLPVECLRNVKQTHPILSPQLMINGFSLMKTSGKKQYFC